MEFRFDFVGGGDGGDGGALASAPPAPPLPPLTGDGTLEDDAAPPVWVPVPTQSALAAARTAPLLDVLSGLPLRRCVVEDADALTGVAADVVAGQYEGGAKVWECTRDLLAWLAGGEGAAAGLLPGRTVMDLGCGAGLLGAYALVRGAGSVLFQDRNAPVLRCVTAPNVAVNAGVGGLARCALLAGSWAGLAAALTAGNELGGAGHSGVDGYVEGAVRVRGLARCVDVVLASEVLYRPDAYEGLATTLAALLRPGTGVAVIATKRHYYGVGGGTDAFASFVAGPGGRGLGAVERIASYVDGHSMVRDLLLLRAPPR